MMPENKIKEIKMSWIIKCLTMDEKQNPYRVKNGGKGCGKYFAVLTGKERGQFVCVHCKKRQRAVFTGGGSAAVIHGPMIDRKECRQMAERMSDPANPANAINTPNTGWF